MKKISCIVSNKEVKDIVGRDLNSKQQFIHSYAISPGESLSMLRNDGVVDTAQWGVQKNESNHKILTIDYLRVHSTNTFRMVFRQNRSIVLMDSYYAWSTPPNIPVRIKKKDRTPLVVPAIFKLKNNVKELILLTRKSRSSLMNYAREEPITLEDTQAGMWLDTETSVDQLILTLSQARPISFEVHPVTNKILVEGYNRKDLHKEQVNQPMLFT